LLLILQKLLLELTLKLKRLFFFFHGGTGCYYFGRCSWRAQEKKASRHGYGHHKKKQ
jgi:hypothetical protein